ncbi:MAG TPA: hypothetical protein VE173_00175, partial [Longimicrobiales bacterium]|nr:hypothetical protein [Longimicrobiales bacterium]
MLAILLLACDQSFEPLAPGGQALTSVFGYLDAAADTQWIRVMPIRPFKTTSPGSSDTDVTLEDLHSGRRITLRDSLVAFSTAGPGSVSGTVFVHDFWTTEKIEAGATYRFSVTRPGEPTAEAVVKIPARFELGLWLHQFNYSDDQDFVRVSGVHYLPFSGQVLGFSDTCGSGRDTLRYPAAGYKSGPRDLTVSRESVAPRRGGSCGVPVVTRRRLWLAASDSVWPVPELSG